MGIAPHKALIYFTQEGGNTDKYNSMHLIDVNPNNTVYNYTDNLKPYGKPGLVIQQRTGNNYCSTMPEHCYYTEEVYDLYNYDWTLELWVYAFNTWSHKSVVSAPGQTLPNLISRNNSSWAGLGVGNPLSLYSPFGYEDNVVFLNQPVHYALVYNSKTFSGSVFVNGTKRVSGTAEKASLTDKRFYFGGGGDGYAHSVSYIQFTPNVKYTDNFTVSTQEPVAGLYVAFPPNKIGKYDKSPNGLVYSYRVRFVQGNLTQTSNVVNYETTRFLSILKKILIINILYKALKCHNF